MDSAPSTSWSWPCRLSQRPSNAIPPPGRSYLPHDLRYPPRPVMIIIDFSPLASLSQRYRYYAAMNRDIYDNLTGYAEQALWQVTRHLHVNDLDRTRIEDLIRMVSHRIMEQWQLVVAPHTLQLCYEDDQGHDVVLQLDRTVKPILFTCRPDWPRRQYDAYSSMDHSNQWVPFMCRLVCRER
eukprot:s2347_g6.t1